MLSVLKTIWAVFVHLFRKRVTIQYPEEKPSIPPRWRGRIILSRDPDGQERCVACYLCAAACPVDCIFCGFCEEACPTYAIQLTTDFEMGEYVRQNLVYEKEDLLISGPGKYHDYNFYRVAGLAIKGKDKGEADNEKPPVDIRSLMP
jgi:NADH-quinone oxidoreductase subunit I